MIQRQKGCNDIYGREAKIWKYVDTIIDTVMEKYNYTYIRTPIIEATELFHRGIGDTTDIVTKESYDFQDKGGRNITLRPEGTAGVVRSYIENKMYGDANQPVKVYYNGTMYRYERPQSGRDRELTQFGMEILGSDDPLSDAEIISLAVNIYKMLGLKEIKVNINSGLGQECKERLDDDITQNKSLFYFFNQVFDLLPFGILVDNTILCIHGGIGSVISSLEDIENIKRPIHIEQNVINKEQQIILDLLYSEFSEEIDNIIKSGNNGALKIKYSDMLDNSNPKRLCDLDEETRVRLTNKYEPELKKLKLELEKRGIR